MAELTVVKIGPVIPPTLQALETDGVATLQSFEWNTLMGSFHNPNALLTLIGLAITAILMANRVKGSLLIGILASTLIGIPMGVTVIPEQFSPFALPDFENLHVFELDIMGAINLGIWTVVFTFTFVELFDTFGTLVGTADKAGLLDKNGQSPKIGKAMMVDAMGGFLWCPYGNQHHHCYVESAAGIGEGGRTGLTAVTTGLMFLLALGLAPLALLIPGAATSPALLS
ncbi:hypothetical protein N752_07600 [Desulforamulus aquiferis]|nr:hypothetical protein N752_07600 [Desulforamulus aquiferis]